MPATYSISVGQPTEALRKQDIYSVLQDLPDNTQKLISPKDVRDAFLSAWSSSAFKQTINSSSIEYIGVDSGNPDNRDIKQKIYIGKRNYAGTDIMSSSLLNSTSTDIYFYNTKSDTSLTQSSTKIAILAGTDSVAHQYAPYLETNYINSSSSIGLNIVNPSVSGGPVNIFSSTGRVAINGILFPTFTETSASASNGKILKYFGTYPNGVLRWDSPTLTIANIGSVGSPTNIYGSPSNVNGYSLEFVDNSIVPQTIGGIEIGSSFSMGSFFNGDLSKNIGYGPGYQNWPIVEVLRKLLYPYVSPSLSLTMTIPSGGLYAEVGVTQSATFSYSITRYSYDINGYQINPGILPLSSYSGPAGSILSGTTISNVVSNTVGSQSFTLVARDNNTLLTFSHSATASIRYVNPIFYGFNSTLLNVITPNSNTLTSIINSLTQSKVVTNINTGDTVTVNVTGSGYIYFLVPAAYGFLSKIKDHNGFVVHDSSYLSLSSFTFSPGTIAPNLGSVYNQYIGNYRVYRTSTTCSLTGFSNNFEFIF